MDDELNKMIGLLDKYLQSFEQTMKLFDKFDDKLSELDNELKELKDLL